MRNLRGVIAKLEKAIGTGPPPPCPECGRSPDDPPGLVLKVTPCQGEAPDPPGAEKFLVSAPGPLVEVHRYEYPPAGLTAAEAGEQAALAAEAVRECGGCGRVLTIAPEQAARLEELQARARSA